MMDAFFVSFLRDLPMQLPTAVVCVIGIYLASERASQQPETVNRALWGFGLLLVSTFAGSLIVNGLVARMNLPDTNLSGLQQLITVVSFANQLIRAVALWLLLRAIFPAVSHGVSPGWLKYLLGSVIGLLLGGILGIFLGDPIGSALSISTFEGGRGYFVMLIVVPAFTIAGAIVGVLVVRLRATAQEIRKTRR